jgi:glyoxylase-like metal-dependent hydrolase (beta-lactamase superfamily II)
VDLIEVAPEVYALIRPDRGLGWSNSGLVGRGGGLVVDTAWDLPMTRAAKDRFAEVHRGVPRWLVNTHHNGDHCWGNQIYAELGTEIIGHRRCAEYFTKEASPEFFLELQESDPSTLPPPIAGFRAALGAFDFRGITLTPPTRLVDDELELDLGGRRAQLLYVGPAHTAGDLAIHLPDDGVLFTGDVLFHECTPIGWEGTYAQWISALERLAALEPAVVIPGHGPLADAGGLLAMRDYLVYVRREAETGFEAGLSAIDTAKRIELGPPYDHWNEPERLAFNVHRAYRELRGEPWDAPVDVMTVFVDVAALREHFARS